MTHHRFALFDADSLDAASSGRLQLRPRMVPLEKSLQALYHQSWIGGYPLVFTTCCSGAMLKPGMRPDILRVPLDASDTAWKQALPSARLIYLEKKAYGNPQVNYQCRAFDMFADNGNAAALVRELAPEEWIVFGNALDLCVNAALEGIVRAGGRVTFLPECMCLGAGGYDSLGTEESRQAAFARWRGYGAREETLATLLARMEAEL